MQPFWRNFRDQFPRVIKTIGSIKMSIIREDKKFTLFWPSEDRMGHFVLIKVWKSCNERFDKNLRTVREALILEEPLNKFCTSSFEGNPFYVLSCCTIGHKLLQFSEMGLCTLHNCCVWLKSKLESLQPSSCAIFLCVPLCICLEKKDEKRSWVGRNWSFWRRR